MREFFSRRIQLLKISTYSKRYQIYLISTAEIELCF